MAAPNPGNGWWVIAPYGESTGSGLSGTVPSGSVVYNASGAIATDLYNDYLNNNDQPVVIGGKKWEAVFGPFATEAEAKAASPESSLGVLGGIIGGSAVGLGNPGNTQAIGGGAATGSAAGQAVNSEFGALETFFGYLSDANLWIRIAKVAIGGAILIVGLAKMTNLDNKVVNAAVKAAPFL